MNNGYRENQEPTFYSCEIDGQFFKFPSFWIEDYLKTLDDRMDIQKRIEIVDEAVKFYKLGAPNTCPGVIPRVAFLTIVRREAEARKLLKPTFYDKN